MLPHARGVYIHTDVLVEVQSDTLQPVASRWHTVAVLALIAVSGFRGWVRADQMRASLNPDRISIYERTIVFEWLVLALVLLGVWINGSTVLTVLGDRWRTVRQFHSDLGIGLLFLFASILLMSIASSHGGASDRSTQFLLPRGRVEKELWVLLSITAGICEEAVYRGYLQRQFMALTKSVPIGIVLSALVFGAAHSYQGVAQATLIGTLGAMGGVLAYWRRSVRPGMIAHVLQDMLGGFINH